MKLEARATYLELFRSFLERAELSETEVRSRLPPATASRAFSEDEASVVTLMRAVEAARELRPDQDFPDPVWLIEGLDQWLWIRAGEVLREHDPVFFRDLLEAATNVSDPILEAQKKKRQALATFKAGGTRSGGKVSDGDR